MKFKNNIKEIVQLKNNQNHVHHYFLYYFNLIPVKTPGHQEGYQFHSYHLDGGHQFNQQAAGIFPVNMGCL